MVIAAWLGIGYGCSEIVLSVTRRAKRAGAARADAGSLALLWSVIFVSLFLAYSCVPAMPQWSFGSDDWMVPLGCVVFALGLALRWYAIRYLGRFFTVDVAIAADHRVVEGGPYRYIRHPSYSGALLAFLGIGLCLDNWGSMAFVVLPILAAFLQRIRVEERALTLALGEQYAAYARRTKRLIPGVV